MKMVIAAVLACGMSLVAAAEGAEWRGLDNANWYSGRKISSADLRGKVVLVDEWGVNCPPCRALLPRIEQIWKAFSSKPFIVIGSHRQGKNPAAVAELVKANGLTYPIYDNAGLVNEPSGDGGLPFMYVVDAAGNVVYQGRSERAATEAVVNALTDMPDPNSLIGDVTLVKFKSLEKSLVFGKNVESKMSTFNSAAKSSNAAAAKEATSLIAAISKSRESISARIKDEIATRPGAALTDITMYTATWPSKRSEFAADYARLSANQEVRKVQRFGSDASKVVAAAPRNASQAKMYLSKAEALKKSNEALKSSSDAAVAKEAEYVTSILDGYISEMKAEVASASSSRRSSRTSRSSR